MTSEAVYHPDPEINAGVVADALAAEVALVSHEDGYQDALREVEEALGLEISESRSTVRRHALVEAAIWFRDRFRAEGGS